MRIKGEYAGMGTGDIGTVSGVRLGNRLIYIKEYDAYGAHLVNSFRLVENSNYKTMKNIVYKTNESHDIELIVTDNLATIKAGCFEGTFEEAFKKAKNRAGYVRGLNDLKGHCIVMGYDIVKKEKARIPKVGEVWNCKDDLNGYRFIVKLCDIEYLVDEGGIKRKKVDESFNKGLSQYTFVADSIEEFYKMKFEGKL